MTTLRPFTMYRGLSHALTIEVEYGSVFNSLGCLNTLDGSCSAKAEAKELRSASATGYRQICLSVRNALATLHEIESHHAVLFGQCIDGATVTLY